MPRIVGVLISLAFGALLATGARAEEPVVVGSKAFPESWILGELLARSAREAGAGNVTHRSNLGGTEIVYQALRSGAIDAYVEYTGTISEVILKSGGSPTLAELRAGLEGEGLAIGEPLGFNDGYGLAVTRRTAGRSGIRTISDLAGHPELELGLTHEFLGRKDGYPGLARHYGLSLPRVRGLQHELAWGALESGAIDVTDVYTTDAQIQALDLVVLADDRAFFPRYEAVIVYRQDLARRAPAIVAAWRALEGRIDEARMVRANARVVIAKVPFAVAAESLAAEIAVDVPRGAIAPGDSLPIATGTRTEPLPPVAQSIARNLVRHVELVLVSLLLAILIGIPLGIAATRSRALAASTLAIASLLQTIPSLALLAFLIPLLGIGTLPSLVALFLYSLLPIVRNTYVGLTTIPASLVEAAHAIGLSPAARLRRVFLPLASPTILAGVRTSAVINVGTATIAALIGAGGLGEPILSGIQLRDPGLILQGAIPAAGLALLAEWIFTRLEPVLIPEGLRLKPVD
ncbi:MAG: glycine betaine ABC transporter substrate-binding protein [Candidatus Eiseniibacteriota bacterium]